MIQDKNEQTNYRAFLWHAVFLSITVTFTEINTVIPALIMQIGGREIHVGIVSAIMIGIPLISKLNFAGYLHGKSRKKPSLLIGINIRVLSLAMIAGTLMIYSRFTFIQLLLILYAELLLFTLSGAFAGISYVDLVGKSFQESVRIAFFTKKQIISSVGILLSAVIARFILQKAPYPVNYEILFAAAAFFLLIAALGFWRIREKPVQTKERAGYLSTLRSIPKVLKEDKNLRIYLLFINAIGIHIALTPFYIAFARDRYYLDAEVASNVLFIQIIGMISASLLWPRVVRKGGFKRILKIFSMLCMLIPLTAIIIGYTAPLSVYLMLFFAVGFTVSAKMISENSVLVELTTEENRVLYSGIAGTMNITIVVFPIALGGLIGWLGYVPVFIAVSAATLFGRLILRKLICPVDLKIHDSFS